MVGGSGFRISKSHGVPGRIIARKGDAPPAPPDSILDVHAR